MPSTGRSTKLPVELLREIFELTAEVNIHSRSLWTANLVLVSRTVRQWLLPVIYRVFFVEHWVEASAKYPRHLHPSRKYFRYLLLTPTAPIRKYIKHLVIMGVAFDGLIAELGIEKSKRVDWEVDSLTLPIEKVDFALQANIKPRRTFATDQYERSGTSGVTEMCLELALFERVTHCRWNPAGRDGLGGGGGVRIVALRSANASFMAPRYFHLQLKAVGRDWSRELKATFAAARTVLMAYPNVYVVFALSVEDDPAKSELAIRDEFSESQHACRVRISHVAWDEDADHSASENVRWLRDRFDPWDIGTPIWCVGFVHEHR